MWPILRQIARSKTQHTLLRSSVIRQSRNKKKNHLMIPTTSSISRPDDDETNIFRRRRGSRVKIIAAHTRSDPRGAPDGRMTSTSMYYARLGLLGRSQSSGSPFVGSSVNDLRGFLRLLLQEYRPTLDLCGGPSTQIKWLPNGAAVLTPASRTRGFTAYLASRTDTP